MTTWRELTFPGNATRVAEITIEDERAGVLTDELRWRILETLGDGKSLEELSRALEVTDARVLHHLAQLARAGVVDLEKNGTDPTTWCCQPAAARLRVRETTAKEIPELDRRRVISGEPEKSLGQAIELAKRMV